MIVREHLSNRVPLKEGYTLYIPPIPFHQYIFPPVIPRIPPLYFPIDRGWYLYDARKDKVYVKLLTSSIGDEGKLKEKIKEGFHDTIFPQTITYIDFSKQFMRAFMCSYSFPPLVRIIFGGSFFITSGYNITGGTAVGAYILYFRSNSVAKISRGFDSYMNKVISGLEMQFRI